MRWVVRVAQLLIAALVLLYAGDWASMRLRLSHGTAFRTIQVNQFLATQLKGNKVEYDWAGTADERCSRSLFPQSGSPACWWLERHRTEWE